MMHSMEELKRLADVFADAASRKLWQLLFRCSSCSHYSCGVSRANVFSALFADLSHATTQRLSCAGKPQSRSKTARSYGTPR